MPLRGTAQVVSVRGVHEPREVIEGDLQFPD